MSMELIDALAIWASYQRDSSNNRTGVIVATAYNVIRKHARDAKDSHLMSDDEKAQLDRLDKMETD